MADTTKRRKARPSPPKFIWSDYDPMCSKGNRWAYYQTWEDQRANRPDLKPIRLRVSIA